MALRIGEMSAGRNLSHAVWRARPRGCASATCRIGETCWQSHASCDRFCPLRGATMISLTVNGKQYTVDVAPDTPLLWVIRDAIGLTGTKFGCGLQQCGACTVHIDGTAVRSCGTLVSNVG